MGKKTVFDVIASAKDALNDGKNAVTAEVVKALDANGDGVFDIQDAIILATRTPGVHVSRSQFLRIELFKNHPESVVEDAIKRTPALAGISSEEIDKIANEVIKYERNCVSGISTALGFPGGLAMAATIPADIAQYYGFTLRAIQKLLYLYGFPEINSNEDGICLDSETVNRIIICLGAMNGVAGANNAIKGLAKALSKGVEKKLLNTALTKGAFYPILKSVLKWFGIRLTKNLFAKSVKNIIPVLGGLVGGGITFFSFEPCCKKLIDALSDTLLSNPNHKSSTEEDEIYNHIINGTVYDANFTDCEEMQFVEATADLDSEKSE